MLLVFGGPGGAPLTSQGPAACFGSIEDTSLAHQWLSPHYFSPLWALPTLTPPNLATPTLQGRADSHRWKV